MFLRRPARPRILKAAVPRTVLGPLALLALMPGCSAPHPLAPISARPDDPQTLALIARLQAAPTLTDRQAYVEAHMGEFTHARSTASVKQRREMMALLAPEHSAKTP